LKRKRVKEAYIYMVGKGEEKCVGFALEKCGCMQRYFNIQHSLIFEI